MNEHQYLWPLLVPGTILLVLAFIMGLVYWNVRQRINSMDYSTHPNVMEEHFRTSAAAFTTMVVTGSVGAVFMGVFFFRTLS